MIIESKAPTRVDFAGSTLDIWPLYLFHPGAITLNAAISLYASCVIETHPAATTASNWFPATSSAKKVLPLSPRS